MKTYLCKIAIWGLCLFLFTMCESDMQSIKNHENSFPIGLKNGLATETFSTNDQVNTILCLPEYAEALNCWINLDLTMYNVISDENFDKKQQMLLIIDKVNKKTKVEPSEFIEMMGKDCYKDMEGLANDFIKSANKFANVLPEGFELDDNEMLNLVELTIRSGLIPIDRYYRQKRADMSLDLKSTNADPDEESLQECLNRAVLNYNLCTGATILAVLGVIGGCLVTGNIPTAVELFGTSLGAGYSAYSCEQSYYRDVNLCIYEHQ